MPIGKKLRDDFPIFRNSQGLHYLDSAATSQKPASVLEAMRRYYEESNANPRRGVYGLAQEATERYEKARERVARFIGAKSGEIVFVRNTTEALNLLSYSMQDMLARTKDRPIALTRMEHHSNFVPWQQAARRTGAKLAFVPFETDRPVGAENLGRLRLAAKTAAPSMLAITHASNVLGTVNDIAGIARHAHEEWECPVVVDAAQAAPHMKIDVKKLDVDFLAFSSHKMLGPTGAGVLYMKEEWRERLPPFMTGGGQISEVKDHASTWAEGPAKFEAGTPDVAGAVGLGAAVEYIERVGLEEIGRHERKLADSLREKLSGLEDVVLYGPKSGESGIGVVSFNLSGVHGHDLSSILDRHGVAVRGGHHCAQPLMRLLKADATVRASFYLYNDTDDIDALLEGLQEARRIFGR